jgi:hypothetical protein
MLLKEEEEKEEVPCHMGQCMCIYLILVELIP